MLRIRFFRIGKKNQPLFRIVVTDKKNPPRGGRFVEELGFWNPLSKEKAVKKERVKYWLSIGAKPSDSVYNLLIQEKVLEGAKISVHKKKKKKEGKTETKKEPKPEIQKEALPLKPDKVGAEQNKPEEKKEPEIKEDKSTKD